MGEGSPVGFAGVDGGVAGFFEDFLEGDVVFGEAGPVPVFGAFVTFGGVDPLSGAVAGGVLAVDDGEARG